MKVLKPQGDQEVIHVEAFIFSVCRYINVRCHASSVSGFIVAKCPVHLGFCSTFCFCGNSKQRFSPSLNVRGKRRSQSKMLKTEEQARNPPCSCQKMIKCGKYIFRGKKKKFLKLRLPRKRCARCVSSLPLMPPGAAPRLFFLLKFPLLVL